MTISKVTFSFVIGSMFFLILNLLGPAFVKGEPEPMARPTRPKVITSPEELRRYLDLVRDYYSLNGKARYGKRANILPLPANLSHPWDTLRMILDLRRQILQEKREKEKKLQEAFQRDEESRKIYDAASSSSLSSSSSSSSSSAPSYMSHPSYPYDILAKYYDEVQ